MAACHREHPVRLHPDLLGEHSFPLAARTAPVLLLLYVPVGGLLYFFVITLIFYRFMFLPLVPRELSPPYWINSGADAISTLAGSTLVVYSQGSRFIQEVLPFLKGTTVLFWAAATWWIPLLLILGAWRHFIGKVDFSYNHSYWGMVFPLGMYTACTFKLAEVMHLPFLMEIARYFIYAALSAWFLTFFGLLRSLFRPVAGEGFGDTSAGRSQ